MPGAALPVPPAIDRPTPVSVHTWSSAEEPTDGASAHGVEGSPPLLPRRAARDGRARQAGVRDLPPGAAEVALPHARSGRPAGWRRVSTPAGADVGAVTATSARPPAGDGPKALGMFPASWSGCGSGGTRRPGGGGGADGRRGAHGDEAGSARAGHDGDGPAPPGGGPSGEPSRPSGAACGRGLSTSGARGPLSRGRRPRHGRRARPRFDGRCRLGHRGEPSARGALAAAAGGPALGGSGGLAEWHTCHVLDNLSCCSRG